MNNCSEAEITYDSNKLTEECLPELIVKLNPKKFQVIFCCSIKLKSIILFWYR